MHRLPGQNPAVLRVLTALAIATVSVVTSLSAIPAAGATTPPSAAELQAGGEFLAQLNAERAARGLRPIHLDVGMSVDAQAYAESLASRGALVHADVNVAEIIARGHHTGQITDAWMRSPGHRHLIVDPNHAPAGFGVACDAGGTMYVVVRFERLDRSLGSNSSSSASPIVTDPGVGSDCDHDEGSASVLRLYLAYFRRPADAGGLEYWVAQRRAGIPLETISEAFAGAPEFLTTYGALSDSQFVRLVYLNVMEREPDQAGVDYWVGRLRAGVTRGEMMIGFSESDEFRTRSGLS